MSTSHKANYFTQIFSSTVPPEPTEEEREREDLEFRKLMWKSAQQRKEFFVPDQKSEAELFDARLHIQSGPHFEENFGASNDADVCLMVQGKQLQMPLASSFTEYGFTPAILENIRKKDYTHPTQIQKAMIPLIQKTDNDIMGHAQTGSGKTAAYLLPLIDELQREYVSGVVQFNRDSPYVIVVAPTRELVNQLYEDALSFATGTQVTVAVAYGGTPMEYSRRMVREGCDILVTTMGRLHQYKQEGTIYFNKLRYLVYDEADRLLMKYDTREQLATIKPALDAQKHRTIVVSATFDEEAKEVITKDFLRPDFCFIRVKEMNSAARTVTQSVLNVAEFSKGKTLMKMLRERSTPKVGPTGDTVYDTERTIIFKNGKRECDRLAIKLAYHGFRVISMHSNRTPKQRRDAVDKFTSGYYHIIVNTDILSRGMNFPNVAHVINYDMPSAFCQYIHRIGRTGRAGNVGRATTFFDYHRDFQHTWNLIKVLNDCNQEVPDFLRDFLHAQQETIRQVEQHQMADDDGQPARPQTVEAAKANGAVPPAENGTTVKKAKKKPVQQNFDDTW